MLMLMISVMAYQFGRQGTQHASSLAVENVAYSVGKTQQSSVRNLQFRQQKLAQAKKALLAYSVSYADNYLPSGAGPGHLPCPDRSEIADGNPFNDGPNPPCSAQFSNIGRFPRFTFTQGNGDSVSAPKHIAFFHEASQLDQQMWYVVSPSHINNPINSVVNPGTKGQLNVDDIADVVAVIIEPGIDINQSLYNRPSDNIAAYLEGDNANNDNKFTLGNGANHNDVLTYITATELYKGVFPRVLYFAKEWLQMYRANHCIDAKSDCYPAAADSLGHCEPNREHGFLPIFAGTCGNGLAALDQLDGVQLSRHWFVRNQWLPYIRYRRHPNCRQDLQNDCAITIEDKPGSESIPHVAILPSAVAK